ncbi:uncharacterized protein G2W53_014484 [Senna tora]|uniref:Uncharacterized protein n=1 Tax=Senna tora TaxID=362788 RepID=A0A835C2P7_9FABA|nr:uncharacterized protein G2W53_014484 [Senna tora]
MGFLAITTCYSKFHRILDLYGLNEETIKVLRNSPMCEPNNRLKGIPKYFKENFVPP